MSLASIEQQIASVNKRLAILNPLRERLGLASIPTPTVPTLDRTDTRHYADQKHKAKIALRNYRLSLDKQIKELNGTRISTPTGTGTRSGGTALPRQSITPLAFGPSTTPAPPTSADSPESAAGPAKLAIGLPETLIAGILIFLLWRQFRT